MEPTQYPSNRQKDKEIKPKESDKPKIEPVVSGEVIRRKKPWRRRFTETFVGGDARTVGSYVVLDVLIPAAKDMVADAMSMGIEKMLFGEARSVSRRGPRPGGPTGYVSYNKYASAGSARSLSRGPEFRPGSIPRARPGHFDEIILATRVEAEEVIDRMFDLVSRYEEATVADLYDLVNVSGSYTDEKWGWRDLRGATVARVRNGYLLDLPKPEPLD